MSNENETDDLTYAIRNTCILACIRTTSLGLNRTDRSASRDVETQNGAVQGAARVVVSRLPGADDDHKAIVKAQGAVRSALVRYSMPYGDDDGWRLLPNANFEKLNQAYANHYAEFRAALAKLKAKAPAILALAKANLGTLAIEVPTEDELLSAYSVAPEFREVAEGRFPGMPPEVAAKLKKHVDKKLQAAVESAVADTLGRFTQPLAYFVERMTLFEEREKALANGAEVGRHGIFRDSVVSNIAELVDVVDSLNVTNDPRITALAELLRPFTQVKPEDLRDDPGARKHVTAQATNALAQLNEWLS